MSVVTSVLGNVTSLTTAVELDPLPLTSAQRASAHFSGSTVGGKIVRVSLPRGTELQDGDVLELGNDSAVVVVAAAEDLLHIRPAGDEMMWWVACYQLGNLHRPARFLDDGILTPYDPMALNVLRGFGVAIERVHRPFVGRRFGAVQSHHHHHSDDAQHVDGRANSHSPGSVGS